MTARTLLAALMLALFGVPLSGCGGGGGSSSGGGGGGGGGSGLSISQLSPSTVMTGLPVGGLTLLGTGFTNECRVLVDGVPVIQTILEAPGTLQAQTDISLYGGWPRLLTPTPPPTEWVPRSCVLCKGGNRNACAGRLDHAPKRDQLAQAASLPPLQKTQGWGTLGGNDAHRER
jgi:hypothetical protein